MPNGQTCGDSPCMPNCASCHWLGNQTQVCDRCDSGYFLDGLQRTCQPAECPDYLLYKFETNECLECPAEAGICATCNEHGCTSCHPDAPLLTEDQKCVSECPLGMRETEDGRCVFCSDNCAECYSYDHDGDNWMEEVCLECANGLYLLQGHGCMLTCPRGYYADDTLGWCVKCSCECDSCSSNKYDCDVCKRPAYKNDEGECVVGSESTPFAFFNDGWESFNLYYPMAGFDVGYRSDFLNTPNAPLLTCKDRMLDLDWNSADFADDLVAVREKFQEITTDEEYAKLLEIVDRMGPIDFGKYKHDFELVRNPWKVLYTVADSLFGMSFDENVVQSRTMNENAIASIIDFEVPQLCEKIFGETQSEINEKFGLGKRCSFLLGGESVGFYEPGTPITAIRVDLDLESADFYPHMPIILSSAFYRFDGELGVYDTENFFNAPNDKFEIEIRSADEPIFIEPDLRVNEHINDEFAQANCNSGVFLDWTRTTGLCGKNMVEIDIDSVFNEGDDYALQVSSDIEIFNDWMRDYLAQNYNGFDRHFTIPGHALQAFIGTRVDFRVILRNCLGDIKSVRRFVLFEEVPLIGDDGLGHKTTYPVGGCS